jgi:hypothetical protein
VALQNNLSVNNSRTLLTDKPICEKNTVKKVSKEQRGAQEHKPVDTRAVDTDEDAVGDAGPGWVLRSAVEANLPYNQALTPGAHW